MSSKLKIALAITIPLLVLTGAAVTTFAWLTQGSNKTDASCSGQLAISKTKINYRIDNSNDDESLDSFTYSIEEN